MAHELKSIRFVEPKDVNDWGRQWPFVLGHHWTLLDLTFAHSIARQLNNPAWRPSKNQESRMREMLSRVYADFDPDQIEKD